ncbi:MAG: hypothetical protein AB7P40_11480 [Chloroflexota bacterium]
MLRTLRGPVAPAHASSSRRDSVDGEHYRNALRTLALLTGAGLALLALFPLQAAGAAQFFAVASVAAMVAAASMVFGGLLGFLFGIPRTLQQDAPAPASEAPPSSAAGENGQRAARAGAAVTGTEYRANTNLDQISDWLTKILVGVGLTQLTGLPARLQEIGEYLAAALGGFPSSSAFAVLIIVYFTICGFLYSYLWTRLYLAGALKQADRSLEDIQIQIDENRQMLDDIERQKQMDEEALRLVERQLAGSTDGEPVSQAALTDVIGKASPSMRAAIYYKAQDVRRNNWDEERNKPRMELTIPVFKALVSNDAHHQYHANHGQLGFALKEKLHATDDDLSLAVSELSLAIQIRDEQGDRGWALYEMCRAICRIKIDPGYRANEASEADRRDRILRDLQVACQSPDLATRTLGDVDVQRWMELNGVAKAQLLAGRISKRQVSVS